MDLFACSEEVPENLTSSIDLFSNLLSISLKKIAPQSVILFLEDLLVKIRAFKNTLLVTSIVNTVIYILWQIKPYNFSSYNKQSTFFNLHTQFISLYLKGISTDKIDVGLSQIEVYVREKNHWTFIHALITALHEAVYISSDIRGKCFFQYALAVWPCCGQDAQLPAKLSQVYYALHSLQAAVHHGNEDAINLYNSILPCSLSRILEEDFSIDKEKMRSTGILSFDEDFIEVGDLPRVIVADEKAEISPAVATPPAKKESPMSLRKAALIKCTFKTKLCFFPDLPPQQQRKFEKDVLSAKAVIALDKTS